jgi:malonyl-CoA O-methyltransferase
LSTTATLAIDAQRVARQFSRHASTYDRYATIQRLMARDLALTARSLTCRPLEILEFGCGTGRLTMLLREAFPAARITAVDIAQRMIAAAAGRLNGAVPGVRFVLADIETMPLRRGAFDAVVSSATIQWLGRPHATLTALARALRPEGLMLHATFGPGTFAELHSTFEAVEQAHGLEPRPHGLELRPADEWLAILEASGLSGSRFESTLHRAEYDGCRALLETIKRTGASYAPRSARERAHLVPEVIRRYDASFRSTGGVYATYELLSLSASAAG